MLRYLLLAPLLSIGCALEPEASERPDAPVVHEDADATLRVPSPGTPEAWGVLAFLNDPHTTEAVLDHEVPLDRRAAQSLIAHRDGPDGRLGTADDRPFTHLDEVASCYYVGPTALARLAVFAESWGYVPLSQDYVGTWEGVAFSWEEMVATLEVANTASHALLDAYLDRRAADAIVAERPIATMDALADTYFVGPVAMGWLRHLALETLPPGLYEACDALDACAAGLVCMGATVWGEGWCVSDELAGTFEGAAIGAIPDAHSAGASGTIEVKGLASVPVDIVVTLDIDHPDRAQLVVTLTDPNGATSVLWDRDPSASDTVVAHGGITRDDRVNGTWTLRVVDAVAGDVGTVHGWELFIVSRWD